MNRRGLRQLVGSLFLFQLGATMTYVGLPLLMAQRYGIGIETGVVLALQLLPSLLLAGPAGVVLERFDPRRVGILSAVASAGVVALFPASTSVLQVDLLALATGVTFVFGIPARMALRTRVIVAGEEVRGNGLLVAGDRLATVLGPGLAGPLVAFGGVDWLFYAEATVVTGAAVLLLGVGAGAGEERSGADDEDAAAIPAGVGGWLRTLFLDPVRGFRRMLREQPIVGALTVTAFGYVAAVGASRLLLAEEAPRLFGSGTGALGFLVAAMAAGGVVGAMVGGRLGRFDQGRLYVVGNLCEALCWPLVPLLHDELVVLGVMFLAGVFESAPTVVYYAEVQARLTPAAVGAYYAWLMPLTQACSIVGALGGSVLLAAGGTVPLSVAMACLIGGPIVVLARILLQAGRRRAIAGGAA
jgi:ENTS family enterobactin (siderophore) exporter